MFVFQWYFEELCNDNDKKKNIETDCNDEHDTDF